MKTITMICLLTCTIIAPCLCGTVPSIAASVHTVGSIKQYTYLVRNDLDCQQTIGAFDVRMPEDGARSVIAFTSSQPGWYSNAGIRPELSFWRMIAMSGAGIYPGEEITFTLTTLCTVPTSYDYTTSGQTSNWWWSASYPCSGYGDGVVPVPIPEPSALMALVGGLGVLGLPMLYRRR